MRNQFRIIAGEWRGRRFSFPDVEGLRPSPDRVRETLFNWLSPIISGARCLDLYAGSGALGLEALSRGADEVVFVDHDRTALAAIEGHLKVLGCTKGRVKHSTVTAYLAGQPTSFDVVFMDPPFNRDLLPQTIGSLAAGSFVNAGSLVYMEAEAGLGEPGIPEGWTLHRSGRAGKVGYHLARVSR